MFLQDKQSGELEPWRQLMLNAVDEIERRGWCKRLVDSTGRVCARGGLICAAGFNVTAAYNYAYFINGLNPVLFQADKELGKYIAWLNPENYSKPDAVCVGGWNNQSDAETVLRVMKECALHGVRVGV